MFLTRQLLSSLLILVSVFGILTTVPTHAQAQITLNPGQMGLFNVAYENKGDVDTVQNAILEIYVGNKLTLDVNSLVDTFAGGTKYCVNPSVISTSASTVGNWGYKISYRPRSSTSNGTPCYGENTAGPATIPASNETVTPASKQGIFSFKATLKSDITDTAGTQLRSVASQGIYATLTIGATNVPSDFAIVVGNGTPNTPPPVVNTSNNGNTNTTSNSTTNSNTTNTSNTNSPSTTATTNTTNCPTGQVKNASGQCIGVLNSILPRTGGAGNVAMVAIVILFLILVIFLLIKKPNLKK